MKIYLTNKLIANILYLFYPNFKQLLLTLLILSFSMISGAQVSDPSFISPSPTAAELGKYGQVPIGLFTGIVSYSIPIYELKSKNLNVPISLSYSSNGFKVDKVATWVGFDWSLIAGGVITRITRGIPDDIGIVDRIAFPADIKTYIDNNRAYSTADKQAIVDHLKNRDPEMEDYEPDLYSFNFAGYSGMFYIDNDNDFITIPYQNLKISYAGGSKTYTIIAPDGIKYIFEAKELSRNLKAEGYIAGKSSYVSYCLTQIIHPRGDVIIFYYNTPSQYSYNTGVAHTKAYCPYVSLAPCQYDPGFDYYPQAISTEITEVLLDSIVSPGFGKVVFNKSFGSLGVYGAQLNSIDIVNSNNELIKSILLAYQFPNTTSYYSSFLPTGISSSTTRLFLDYVEVKDKIGSNVQKFAFEYENLSGLPVRLSFSKDHWGYFNGKSNNSCFPSDAVPTPEKSNFTNVYWANRAPDANYSKRGMLRKITYPTGGYTEIAYEANKQFETKEIGGVRVAQTTTYSYSGDTHPVIKKYEYSGGQIGTDLYSSYYHKYVVHSASIHQGIIDYPVWKLSDQTFFSMGRYCGVHIGYEKVNVKHGLNGENGTVETQFKISFDSPSIKIDNIDYGGVTLLGTQNLNPPPFSNTGWSNGEKQKEIFYNSNMVKIKEIQYDYRSDLRNETTNYFAVVRKTSVIPFGFEPQTYCGDGSILQGNDLVTNWEIANLDFDAQGYALISKWRYLSSETETDYDKNGQNPVTRIITYYYDNASHAQLTRQETTDSRGSIVKKIFRFPDDYTTTSFNLGTLKSKNIINVPIDIRTYVNSTFTEGQQIKYNAYGQQTEIYKAETTGPDITFSPSIPYKFPLKSTFYYNPNNDIQQVTNSNNYSISYLWSYGNTLPIAEIVNATFSQVSSSLGTTFINTLGSSTNQSTINSWISQLRTTLSSTVPDAHVTTYKYSPLIGLTSKTNANGLVINYDYDDFGRLKDVKNDDGHIAQHIFYHYYHQRDEGLFIEINPISFSSLPVLGGTEAINITSNTSWTAAGNASWISISPVSGTGNGNVVLSYSSNSGSNRSGTVTVKSTDDSVSKSISVSQSGVYISVSPNTYSTSDSGGNYDFDVDVQCNSSWSVSISGDDHIIDDVYPSSGSGNRRVSIDLNENEVSSGDVAYVRFQCGNLTYAVQVTIN